MIWLAAEPPGSEQAGPGPGPEGPGMRLEAPAQKVLRKGGGRVGVRFAWGATHRRAFASAVPARRAEGVGEGAGAGGVGAGAAAQRVHDAAQAEEELRVAVGGAAALGRRRAAIAVVARVGRRCGVMGRRRCR